MAWYSLYKWFAPWRKKPFIDWVYWYSNYVLKTEEQRKSEKETKREKARTALAQLLAIQRMVTDSVYK